MSKKNKEQARCTTSIRPRSLRLAQLAAPFVDESITDFISKPVADRATQVLKAHKAELPSDVAAL